MEIFLLITKRNYINSHMNQHIDKLTGEAKEVAVSQMLGVFGNRPKDNTTNRKKIIRTCTKEEEFFSEKLSTNVEDISNLIEKLCDNINEEDLENQLVMVKGIRRNQISLDS